MFPFFSMPSITKAISSIKGKVDFRGCPAASHSQEYCKGYGVGYNDEGRFYLLLFIKVRFMFFRK
jgi:hypothetical protein